MVNYVSLNCPSENEGLDKTIRLSIENCFKFTKEVNVHVLYNFKAPINNFGRYGLFLFIDIPYRSGNYYRNKEKVYLNSLAIAISVVRNNEIVRVDDEHFYTNDACWSYIDQMSEDISSLRNFVCGNLPEVKYFNFTEFCIVSAPNCPQTAHLDSADVNIGQQMYYIVNNALNRLHVLGKPAVNCVSYTDSAKSQSSLWTDFISNLINKSEEYTKQGILTKKKIDKITEKRVGKQIELIANNIGKSLGIIKGKAGTGKTLALLKVHYNQIRGGDDAPHKNCRLLTYNNLLVADIKQTLRHIGDFTPTKSSISTLHKYFYDIYKLSPVSVLHMDNTKMNKILSLCRLRIAKVNHIFKQYLQKTQHSGYLFPNEIDNIIKSKQELFLKSETEEVRDYVAFCKKKKISLNTIKIVAEDYIVYKKCAFHESVQNQIFFANYNLIIKELYLMFRNIDEFINKYGLKLSYSLAELRESDRFKEKYQAIYNRFLLEAEERFKRDDYRVDELLPKIEGELVIVEKEIEKEAFKIADESNINDVESSIAKIKRKVNWSRTVLVDEAQDCQVYEKALLFELHGPENVVVSTGGRDQLIRTPIENTWDNYFGKNLASESVTLRSVSNRQKGNIVNFLNTFAREFALETEVAVNEKTLNTGSVIIDCSAGAVFNDTLGALYMKGADMGCSNFENMMLMFPRKGYTTHSGCQSVQAVLDRNDTIRVSVDYGERHLSVGLPEYLNVIDGTVNNKKKFVDTVGQANTRCILYDSCRGLEAWNVICFATDVFFQEKRNSVEAEEYATKNANLMYAPNEYQEKYAALWCYMAFTRAIDTLYIRIKEKNNPFSQRLLKIAKSLPTVTVIE